MRVALFLTCVNDTLYPDTGRAVISLLSRLGVDVEFPAGQTCCGQAHYNTGYRHQAEPLAEQLSDVFREYEAIVTPSGSCGAMVRELYPRMGERARAEGRGDTLARTLAPVVSKTYELTEFLVDVLGVTDVGAYYPHTVTYHPTCHGLRSLGLADRPRRLLQAVKGLELRELPGADECCGFGGTFAVKNSDVFDIISGGKISGKYSSTTINGAISGRGFTIGIIDDPVKGAEAADSPTIRQKTWNWYESEFSKRKAPNAAIIIMTTRWNEDDLVGRLLRLAKADPRADQWEVLSLPAMFEQRFAKPYDIRTIEDEGLWLDYYGQEHYEKERANTSTYYFSALMQQRPSAHEGNVFKRQWYLQKNGQAWSLPHLNGEMKSCCAYWDLAYSENPKADQTAGCLMLTDKSMNEWIADMRFGRWEIAKRNQEILAKCIEWGELFPNIKVYLESGMGAGVQDVLELKKLLIHNGIKAETDNVKDNKVFRATKEIGSFQSASQSGMIKFCEGEWNEPALLELSRLIEKETATGMEFTGGHDDILDALVGCHRKLTKPKLPNFFGAN